MNKSGYDGFQGKLGLKGPTGAQGITGPSGFQGIAGNVGYPGINGVKGGKGEVGMKGFDGFQGNAGLDGPDGPIGAQGNPGANGPIGNAGILKRGPVGKNGYDAFLATYDRGRIDNMLNGVISQNSDNPLLTKITGLFSNGGAAYCPGIAANSSGIVNGFQGINNYTTQANNSRSFNLTCTPINLIYDSNFLLAEKYYVFNPETFYQGNLGSNGVQGFRGVKGYQGVQGIKGIVGKHGPVGPDGFPGNVGPDGPIGERGPRGDQGPPGVNGEAGKPGIQGPQGEVGDIGDRGPSYVGAQGKYGYQGKVSVDFTKCVPLTPSRNPFFNCPNDTWLAGIHTDIYGNFGGACCPYIIYDDNSLEKYDNRGIIDADKNGKPYPKANLYEGSQVTDQTRYRNLYNSYNPSVPINNVSGVFTNKTQNDLQILFQNDVKAYYNSTL